jgi:hypothetical protein
MAQRSAHRIDPRPAVELLKFEWARDEGGYQVVAAPPGGTGSTLLTKGSPVTWDQVPDRWRFPFLAGVPYLRRRGGAMAAFRAADLPLKGGSVHREFARLDRTPEAVVAFADQFGYLGLDGRPADDPVGEPLQSWFDWIVRIEHGSIVCDDFMHDRRNFNYIIDYFKSLPPVSTYCEVHQTNTVLHLHYRPLGLLGYIIFLLQHEVTRPAGAKLLWKRCEECAAVIPIGHPYKDPRTQFCSNACKVANGRRRRAAAKRQEGHHAAS